MASPPRKSPRKKRLSKWRVFLLASGSIFAVASIALLIYVISVIARTPEWHPDELTKQKQTSFVFDKDGNQIAALHATENRQMAESSEIPQLVKKAFIAVEDKRFNEHFGIDPIRIVGSLIADIKAQSMREGASTITMQLANNAFIENPTEKSLDRKLQQAALAIQLEREYTKDEILTFYLNRIFFGESSFGIQAAAKTYFGKELKDLQPDEIALLAGLPQAPSGYDPFIKPEQAKNRRTIVLGVMQDSGLITQDEYTKYKDTPFTHVENVKKNRAASQKPTVAGTDYKFPYFIDHVIDQLVNEYNLSEDQIFSGGLKIHTTVDPLIQEAAEKEFANAKNFPQSVDSVKVQGAMTIIEPSTGAIRAIIGGRDHTTARGLNRATQASRQPGSTIKPLVVYAPAIEKGGFFPGTVLDDMPVEYNGGDGKVWAPVDFDTESSGWKGRITMRYAVENSVNVYAVKLMNLIGIDYAWKFGKERLGLPLANEDKVLSLSLGTTHVSTLEMASAYGVFANNGIRVTPHSIEKVIDSSDKEVLTPKITKERTMKETTAYIINSMLRSVVTNGTGTRAQFGNWAVAGKTGTTSLDPNKYGNRSGNPDAWFAGYTPNYVGVVWMGYDSDEDKNHYLRKVYGGSFPAQIWKNVMSAAHQGQTVQSEFKQPSGIVSGSFDAKSGLLPSSLTPSQFVRTEIAAQGDFPTRVSDIWIEKDVDATNPTYLAGEGTRNKLTKVFLNITDRDATTPWPNDEAPFKMPTEAYSGPNVSLPVTSITPPAGDPKLPVPTLGPVAYDAAKGSVTIPVAYPAASKNLKLIMYVKFPGESSIQTFTPEAQPGKSDRIQIPLNMEGNTPVPGEYIFWAAFKDPKTPIPGQYSPAVKLIIND
jgi:penicillin-binding protein 1A